MPRPGFLSLAACALSGVCACAAAACPDPPDLGAELREPAKVFPAFQELLRCGSYDKARHCLSPGAQKIVSYEQFYFVFTAFEAARRLIATAQVHAIDADKGRVRLCSSEFGLGRDFGLSQVKLGGKSWFALDLTSEDIEYFKSRALDWHRLQVKRADGWHYAYPPDWSYAPLGRSCICGKTS